MLSKVIIPVAGLGTRVLPASKAIPKEMLPVVDKRVIPHVDEEALRAGFRQIVLVTRSGKESIENHFDANYELEQMLALKNKQALLDAVENTLPKGIEVISVRQPSAKGLGHAVRCAAHVVGGDDFAVMLPDMVIDDEGQSCDFAEMVKRYQKNGAGQIMVEGVPQEHVDRYGIVDCGGIELKAGMGAPIRDMIEKPKRDEAPSNQAIVGRYILPNRVMQLLKTTEPGAGGEIQLTDAMLALLKEQPLEAFSMRGTVHDCGNKAGLLQANLAFGLKHPETGDALREFIKSKNL